MPAAQIETLTGAKKLLELMGGAIGVESKPGKGNCIWFILPLPAAAPAGRSRECLYLARYLRAFDCESPSHSV